MQDLETIDLNRPAEIRIGSGIRIAVLVFCMLSACVAVWACVDLQKFFAAIGMLALSITLLPFLVLNKYDVFSPWSFVLLSISMGSTAQCVCITLNWPSEDYVDATMLLGRSTQYFYYPALIYLCAIALLTIGFFLPIRFSTGRLKFRRRFHPKRTIMVLGICLLVSMVATAAYVRLTGGLSSGRISDKRTTISTLDVGSDSELQQYGHLKQLGQLAPITFLVFYSFVLSRQQRPSNGLRLMLAIAFLIALVMPFYASVREDVAWLFIGTMGVAYYHRQKNVFRNMAILALAGASVFVAMSFLRNTDTSDAIENASFTDAFRSLIMNRNGPGLAKTSHVINHVPDPLEFQYGKTIAIWAIAPIPRAIYPSKPLIHSGPIIGTTIYGTKTSGVPPGLIGEMYWNFHLAGVIVGMFILGLLLRAMYEVYWNSNSEKSVLIPIYLFSLITIGYATLGHSLGYGLVSKTIDFATVAVVVLFCTTRDNASDTQASELSQ